jgi:uncharacterized protein (DUF58 family)
LDPAFLRQIEQLKLVNSRRLLGDGKGERRSVRRGSSLEFKDYRQYSPGDDLRQVDWNAYGRLGALHLKLYEEEEMLTVHLLVDASKSMDWGEPNKFDFARKLSASIACIALGGYDRVDVAAVGERVTAKLGMRQGPSGIGAVLRFLSSLTPSGATRLDHAVRGYAVQGARQGMVMIVSDLLSPEGWEAGIHELLQRRFEVAVLHVLAPAELDPLPGGDLRLVDKETGHVIEVTLDQPTIELYKRRFREWTAGIESFCNQHQVLYQRLSSARPLRDVLFQDLRARMLLR